MAATAPGLSKGRFLTLSFSGAGHLLPYHLGVASSLLQKLRDNAVTLGVGESGRDRRGKNRPAIGDAPSLPPVRSVSGSSSGAIAAVVFCRFPNKVDELADRFISDRGDALRHLREMFHDAERRESSSSDPSLRDSVDVEWGPSGQKGPRSLHVAVTRCSNGKSHQFSFPGHGAKEIYRSISAGWDTDRLLRCVEASCLIPRSFHPVDMLDIGRIATYPNEDGICIDGVRYADGGIATPAPPTPHDREVEAVRVLVSPISGSVATMDSGVAPVIRISPSDFSWNLFPMEVRCRGNFLVRPSIQNLSAMGVSLGFASRQELRKWHEQGLEDGKFAIAQLSF